MKNKIGYLGLLGIPLAVLGVVGSVAFAQTNIPPAQTQTPASAQVEQTTGPDMDNIQDQANDNKPDSTLETEGIEVPETGVEAANEAPGGHEDIGANVDHQFEGAE